MDGFKNSTKTQYFKGGAANEAKGAAKVAKVMGEFKSGKLHSGSKHGPEVTSKKQATAIAMSEARKAGAKMPMKKAEGGSVEADDALMARMTPKEMAMGRAGIAAARARLSGKKLPPKAVPVAPKRPLIESKAGGVVKKAVGGPVAPTGATTNAATTNAAATNASTFRPTPEMATAANARINARMAARNTPEVLARQKAAAEKQARYAAGAARSAALIQRAKDTSAKAKATLAHPFLTKKASGGLAAMPKGKC